MNIALILSGGIGTRLGAKVPKQYIEVNNKPIISWCMDVFQNCDCIDAFQIVAADEWIPYIEDKISFSKKVLFSSPGENRQLSIFNALNDINKYLNFNERNNVIIHDAARPFVTELLINDICEQLLNHDAVMPALPVKDTMYLGCDGKIESTIDRNKIISGQSPEGFEFIKYYEACKKLLPNRILEINGSSEPAILNDMDIIYVPGDEHNFKITTKNDLERFKTYVGL